MAWTRRRLRIWSALCAALLVYAAIPHVHEGGHGVSPAARAADGGEWHAVGVLVPDDAHESHSASLVLDADPCALCRGKSTQELATVHPSPLRVGVCERNPCETLALARRPELLLAQRHPARAPPRA